MEWRILTSSGQLVRGDKQGIGEHSLSVQNASGLTPTRLFHRRSRRRLVGVRRQSCDGSRTAGDVPRSRQA